MRVPPEVMMEAVPYLLVLAWFVGIVTGWALALNWKTAKQED